MRVAIIGAGVSGMACAHELERHGIFPVIYEQRHRPGELFDHCAVVLQSFTRPYDPLSLLRERFNLALRPASVIKKIVMKSDDKKTTINGKLGYFFMRGHDPLSVETQLYRKLKCKVIANTKVNYTDLSGRFDYVVAANGSYNMGRMAGVWTPAYPTNLVGGAVVGNFDVNKMIMWLDTRYSGTAYAYLTPMERKRAFLGLVVPHSTPEEARRRWQTFWELERHPYDIVNEVIVEHNAGFVYPHQVGNVMFAGVAGGFMEPLLGFALVAGAASGVLAARAIAGGQRYEDLLARLKEDMKHSFVLRSVINNFKNDDFDRLVTYLGAPGLRQVIYNTNIDVLKVGAPAVAGLKKFVKLFKNK